MYFSRHGIWAATDNIPVIKNQKDISYSRFCHHEKIVIQATQKVQRKTFQEIDFNTLVSMIISQIILFLFLHLSVKATYLFLLIEVFLFSGVNLLCLVLICLLYSCQEGAVAPQRVHVVAL